VRAYPGNTAAALLLATAHRRCGDTQAALAEFSALAAQQPGSAPIRLELARALAAAGRDGESLAALEQAVALAPDLAPAWRELSQLHGARGENTACDVAWARFEKLAPQEGRLAEAATALANERLEAAESLLRRALRKTPGDVFALRLLAELASAREDYGEAERLLAECLRLAPGFSRARLDLVQVLQRQLRGEPMLPLLERLLALEPHDSRYRTLQAAAYNLLGQNERATGIFESLLREDPGNALAWLHYGHTLRAAGRQPEAIAAYRRCTAVRPQFGNAWYALANLKTFRFSAGDVTAMQAGLAREELQHEDRVHLEFALGEACEAERDYSAAFAHYARGNELRRALVRYDRTEISRVVERSQALFTREFFAARAGWGSPSCAPIFIVGMPRAGSTLLEQILASHSQVEGTRELTDMLSIAIELGAGREEPGRSPEYPQSVARLGRGQLAALGERYLAQTRAHRPLGRAHFIDKMGSNFLNVPLIQLMLPNARIIDARRGALGCCFSNFKQHFQTGLWFTYSLEDLGYYYREYVRIMAHLDAVLPGRVYRVRYEHLVADLEGEVRRLLEHCGLPFEEQCLRFYETRRNVQTVSSEQVRQPLYREGLDQWRHFEPWLGPLREALGDLAEAPRAAQA
jgi:predicted Zn-dependent protease